MAVDRLDFAADFQVLLLKEVYFGADAVVVFLDLQHPDWFLKGFELISYGVKSPRMTLREASCLIAETLLFRHQKCKFGSYPCNDFIIFGLLLDLLDLFNDLFGFDFVAFVLLVLLDIADLLLLINFYLPLLLGYERTEINVLAGRVAKELERGLNGILLIFFG